MAALDQGHGVDHEAERDRAPVAPQRLAVGGWGLFVASRLYILCRQSPLGPVDPAFQALSRRLEFAVRRHKFNADYVLGFRV